MSNEKRETRFSRELRATSSGDGAKKISGYAATYGVETTIQALGFREILMPGCFDKTVADQDECQCFFNHDVNFVLGRVASGTLKLRADDKGLFYEVSLPSTQTAETVWEAVNRNDVVGASFGFYALRVNWIEATKPGQLPLRQILEAKVFDVSPCSQPQYVNGPTANARNFFPDGVPAEVEKRMAQLRDAMDTSNAGALIPVGGPVPFQKCSKRSEDPFDAVDEANGIINWASEKDEERAAGDKRINVLKAAQGFAYVNGDGSKRSDYILPHHTIVDGELAHSYMGSLRSLGALAAGKVDIPEQHRAEVRSHLLSEMDVFNNEPDDLETQIERSRLRVAVAKLS